MLDCKQLKKRYKVTCITGGVFIFSVFVYAFIGLVFLLPAREPRSGTEILSYVFYAFSLSLFAVIPLIRKIAMKVPIVSSPSADPFFLRLHTSALVTLWWCQLPAILGLVLIILTGKATSFYILAGISLVQFAVFFPRYRRWEEMVRAEERRRQIEGQMGRTS